MFKVFTIVRMTDKRVDPRVHAVHLGVGSPAPGHPLRRARPRLTSKRPARWSDLAGQVNQSTGVEIMTRTIVGAARLAVRVTASFAVAFTAGTLGHHVTAHLVIAWAVTR